MESSRTALLEPIEPDLTFEQPTLLDRRPPGSARFDSLRAYGPRIMIVAAVVGVAGLVAMWALLGRSDAQTDSVAASARSLAASVATDCATGQVVNADTCAQAEAVATAPAVVTAAPSDPTVSPVTVDTVVGIVNRVLDGQRREAGDRPLDVNAVGAEVSRQLGARAIPADPAQVRQIVATALAGQQQSLSPAEVRGIVASALADQPAPVPGPAGERGEPGAAGAPGAPGLDGAPGTPGRPPEGWTFTDSTGRSYSCTRANADDTAPRYACAGEGGAVAPEPTSPAPTPEETTTDVPDEPN